MLTDTLAFIDLIANVDQGFYVLDWLLKQPISMQGSVYKLGYEVLVFFFPSISGKTPHLPKRKKKPNALFE